MKKTALAFLAVVSITMSTHAKILRVNNVNGTAPYATIQAAVNAAENGDTIMVEGSATEYDGGAINKRVVLVGPGYLLRENGIVNEADQEAIVNDLKIYGEGTVIMGLHIGGSTAVEVHAPKVVITRCRIGAWDDAVLFFKGADNCVIHQNLLTSSISSDKETYNHLITNNLCDVLAVHSVHNSYIAYNTNYGTTGSHPGLHYCAGNKVEKNVVHREGWSDDDKDNTYIDNYVVIDFDHFSGADTDKQVLEKTNLLPADVTENHGAFAGDDPYVISGIPAGPVIEQLMVPASVEEGSKLNVTIKLGLQK